MTVRRYSRAEARRPDTRPTDRPTATKLPPPLRFRQPSDDERHGRRQACAYGRPVRASRAAREAVDSAGGLTRALLSAPFAQTEHINPQGRK